MCGRQLDTPVTAGAKGLGRETEDGDCLCFRICFSIYTCLKCATPVACEAVGAVRADRI